MKNLKKHYSPSQVQDPWYQPTNSGSQSTTQSKDRTVGQRLHLNQADHLQAKPSKIHQWKIAAARWKDQSQPHLQDYQTNLRNSENLYQWSGKAKKVTGSTKSSILWVNYVVSSLYVHPFLWFGRVYVYINFRAYGVVVSVVQKSFPCWV